MSLTRWFVSASFMSALIALSLQPGGIANATSPSLFLVTDPSSSNSQNERRDSRRLSDAESSGKMQRTDPRSGSGNMDPNSNLDRGASQEQRGGASQSSGRQDSNVSGNPTTSTSSGSSNMSGGSGTGASTR